MKLSQPEMNITSLGNEVSGAQLAELLRRDGRDIPRKAEAEQAHVIHLLLLFYLRYGSTWHAAAEAHFSAIANRLKLDSSPRG
ncbi:hypothetical protein [Anatilimnocola floriformis]|uniref:hypothetical protein n=1 Tax=Anatilimnocola floriformis TaxID=2948575 RepID=UPI0020C3D4E3|nr:hypothetical protein [Anatilimnocola floriformis]